MYMLVVYNSDRHTEIATEEFAVSFFFCEYIYIR